MQAALTGVCRCGCLVDPICIRWRLSDTAQCMSRREGETVGSLHLLGENILTCQ